MNTGLVESWNGNPLDMGPLYPFVGMEIPLFLVCFLLWIVYTVWQIESERRAYRMEIQELSKEDNLNRTIESNRERL